MWPVAFTSKKIVPAFPRSTHYRIREESQRNPHFTNHKFLALVSITLPDADSTVLNFLIYGVRILMKMFKKCQLTLCSSTNVATRPGWNWEREIISMSQTSIIHAMIKISATWCWQIFSNSLPSKRSMSLFISLCSCISFSASDHWRKEIVRRLKRGFSWAQ